MIDKEIKILWTDKLMVVELKYRVKLLSVPNKLAMTVGLPKRGLKRRGRLVKKIGLIKLCNLVSDVEVDKKKQNILPTFLFYD